MKQEKILNTAKQIVELYYSPKSFTKYMSKDLIIIGNNIHRGEPRQSFQVVHKHYRITLQSGDIVTVVGTFRLLQSGGGEGEQTKERMCVTSLVLNCTEDEIKVMMLHISEKGSDKKYRLEDAREHCYIMDELDVFYLEAGHNRTRWHCREEIIETAGTLKCTERSLSDSFVRIHRGFIVNRLHVRKIGRCYVELDNGEMLQIPVKKYTAVKEQLKRT